MTKHEKRSHGEKVYLAHRGKLPERGTDEFRRQTTEHLYGSVWGDHRIGMRARSLVTLAVLGHFRRVAQLEGHQAGAKRQGVSKSERRAALKAIEGWIEEGRIRGFAGCETTLLRVTAAAVHASHGDGDDLRLRHEIKRARRRGMCDECLFALALHVAHYAGWPVGDTMARVLRSEARG